ncbi:MAG: hypothetical protein GC171_00935 [Terrimonas sp.]|nr:hypothetical protein [Terrimonas sp.]
MNQGSGQTAIKNDVRALNILFNAIFMGVIIFTGIVVFLNWMEKPVFNDSFLENIFGIICGLMAIVCTVLANWIYRKKIQAMNLHYQSVEKKIMDYRGALITYLALCDGPAIFGVICYMITGHSVFLLLTAFMLYIMIQKRPVKARIITDLQLNSEEQMKLD